MVALLAPPPFTCRVTRETDRTAVTVEGDLDLFSSRSLKSQVEAEISVGARAFVVDLTGVTFSDLTTLTYLVDLRRRARCGEFVLELIAGPPSVMRLFDVTDTIDLLRFASAA